MGKSHHTIIKLYLQSEVIKITTCIQKFTHKTSQNYDAGVFTTDKSQYLKYKNNRYIKKITLIHISC